MKIKYRKELRSRYAKFVFHNLNGVVCQCHMSRCDRKSSRIPVKNMKCLSQKSIEVRVFVWKSIFKITPLSSKLHGYISCSMRSQIERKQIITGLRFVKKRKKLA